MEPTKSDIDKHFNSPEMRRLESELKRPRLKQRRVSGLSVPHVVVGVGACIMMVALLLALSFSGVQYITLTNAGVTVVLASGVLAFWRRHTTQHWPQLMWRFAKAIAQAVPIVVAIAGAALLLSYMAGWRGPP
jgi:uncharacterized membrane protein HdeD (DUF308 family)